LRIGCDRKKIKVENNCDAFIHYHVLSFKERTKEVLPSISKNNSIPIKQTNIFFWKARNKKGKFYIAFNGDLILKYGC
jgi:hypothetical protein